MKVKIKKLFNGFASVRDYIIQDCIERNENLIIEYNNESMFIGQIELDNFEQIHKRKFKSKFNEGQEYELYDFKFKSNNQLKLI